MKWSDKIKELRNKLFITHAELGEMLGTSFSTVNRWEQDLHEPTMKMKRKENDKNILHSIVDTFQGSYLGTELDTLKRISNMFFEKENFYDIFNQISALKVDISSIYSYFMKIENINA